jgi:hypothetical protein
VRGGLAVRPVAGGDAEPRDPMHVEAALRAVEDEVLELALEVGLHLQELKSEHLRVDRDRMIASTSSLRLVNEFVGLDRLLGNGADGVLGISRSRRAMSGRLERLADLLEACGTWVVTASCEPAKRAEVEAVCRALVEQRTLTGTEVRAILSGT